MGKEKDQLCTLLITFTDFDDPVKQITTVHSFSSTDPRHYPQRRRIVHRETTAADADKEDEPTVTVTRSAESAGIGNLGSDMIERGLVFGLQDERIPGSKIQALNAHEVSVSYKRDTFEQQLLPRRAADAPRMGTFTVTYPVPPRTDEAAHRRQYSDISDTVRQEQRVYEPESRTGAFYSVPMKVHAPEERVKKQRSPPVRHTERRTPPVTMPLEQHARSFESIHESVSRSRKGTRMVYERRTSEEILTRRTGNGRPRPEQQKQYGAPRPEELHRYQQRERRLPRYHEDDIRLYTRYDDTTRQAEGRHRLPERYRPATAPPPPPYREPPSLPVTTTHFAEEVITTEEHMISRSGGRPPPPTGVTPFGSKQSFTKVTSEKPIPPAVEETRRRERVVETKEPEILKPRLIDYETYRKELERLQREATRTTRELEEPRPLPLAPTIVVPHSPRPRELKDPRAIKYFTSTEVEEHEEYIRRGRPYPPPSPTPANTPATPYAEQRAAAEKAREASLESFREKIDVLRSSHRFRPLHQEAPVESPPYAALSPTSDTTQRAESVSPSRFVKPQTPVPTPEPPREREPSPSPMKRVIEETILVLEERKTTGIRVDVSPAREEQPLSPIRDVRKEELVIETKILDFARPVEVPEPAAPPPTAVVPEVPHPFKELPPTTETGTEPEPVPHGVDVQTQMTEEREDIGTQMELVTTVTEAGTQSEVTGETDADRRLLETLRRELQYEEIVDYEIQRRIRERHDEKKPAAEEQPRIEEVTEFPVVEEEEATTFPADDSGYHEQLLSPIPEARREELYVETKVAEFVQPHELPAPIPDEEDEALFEETVEIDVHQRFIEEQRRRIEREQAKRREAEEAQKRAQEAAEEEQRSFEERVDIETRETMASVERRPKKAATPPKVSPKPSPVTVKRAPSPVRTTTTTELKFRPFEPSSSPSPRMEYHNGAEYRSTISSRSGFARPQRVLSPTPTGGRMLKLVSETSSIASGLSPYGGSTAASTIRDTRERERKEMSDLNDRLASYIEKVRFLEAQNRKLAADLDHLRNRWGRDATSVRDMYEGDLRQAQKVIDETNRQREDLEHEIRKLQEEIAEYRHRYDDALRAHGIDKSIIDELIVKLSGLESEVNVLKRRIALVEGDVGMTKRENHHLIQELQRARIDVDQETLNRIDYQNQVQALLEEIGFLKRAHDSEILDLQAMASRDTTSENREFFKNELASAIREIREEYDKICNVQRTDMESWYRLKVQEIQTQSARQSMEQTYAKDEVKRLRVNLGDLRGKLADLEARNSILEKQVEELNYQLEDDQRSYESALNDRDVQIRKIRDECQTLMVELQMLLDTKQTLDAEIAIYRKMLEGEEDRAGLRQLVEQVVRTHHHKHADETETTRVLRGETASRQSYQRSAKGNVSISEADPHGKFIILENTHRSKEEHIGEWKLKRKLDGRREVVYTFPRDFVLMPAKTVKIWARNQGLHNPPDQLVFDGEDTFGSGNNVHNFLYNTQGEERAALTQRTSQTVTGH